MFMSSEWTQSVGFWFTYKYALGFYFRRLPIIVQVISVSISVDIVKLYIYIYTLGTNMRIRKMVARSIIPPENIPFLVLMYALSRNVTRTRVTKTTLEIYTSAATYFESLRIGIFTFLVWKAKMRPTICSIPRYRKMNRSQ